VRIGDHEFFGSERSHADSIEAYLIPKLKQEYGPYHRLVLEAERHARELRRSDLERLKGKIEKMSRFD
jgi:hypothetical protein